VLIKLRISQGNLDIYGEEEEEEEEE